MIALRGSRLDVVILSNNFIYYFIFLFLQLHSKKRNRLAQQYLNDLVFVKYNRVLRRRYNRCDTIDPISLKDIDDSNKWLVGRIDGGSNNNIELVYDVVSNLFRVRS